MEYIPTTEKTVGKILCCDCGIPIEPNPSNQCIGCVRAKNDITEAIPKTGTLYFCRNCERYLDPPEIWVLATLESKELLRLCLKKVKGLNTVRLVDAGFAWTEPHSKRIKTKLKVQKELGNGAILQQDFIVEFTIHNLMCTDCHRIEAKDFWTALIQVRQKTHHKRTFYYLEQLILKHKVHQKALGIKAVHGGLDFYFAADHAATRMLNFLTSVIPCKWVRSKKLNSHDIRSNIFNYKYTISVEIVPICKDSLVCLPSKLAHQLGGINQICVVHRVSNHIFLIDPSTAQMAEIDNATYWKIPFASICSSRKLVEFTVIEITEADVRHFTGQGQISHKHLVSEVWVEKTSELGTGNAIFCRTHLGNHLKHGDSVMGFDLRNTIANDSNIDKICSSELPDVVLVKKVFADKALRNRKRKWKLLHLKLDVDDMNSQNKDYMDFIEELEEDPEMRTNVNIYLNKEKIDKMSETQSELGDDVPTIPIEEMLEDLVIDEVKPPVDDSTDE